MHLHLEDNHKSILPLLSSGPCKTYVHNRQSELNITDKRNEVRYFIDVFKHFIITGKYNEKRHAKQQQMNKLRSFKT